MQILLVISSCFSAIMFTRSIGKDRWIDAFGWIVIILGLCAAAATLDILGG